MNPARSLLVCASLTLFGCAHHASSPAVAASAPSAPSVTLRAIGDGVWLHTSMHHLEGMGLFPSHGLVIEGPSELLLIDTAWGPAETRDLLAQVRARFGRLPTAAIVTHWHDDRVGGLAELHAAHIPVYATAATAALVAAHGGGSFDGELSSPLDRRTLAGTEIEVFFPGAAHTLDNVVVWFPSRALLFGGCMIRPAGSRALGNLADADVAAWPASAQRVAERYASARVVVPSHGEPGDAALLTHTVELARAAATQPQHDAR